MVDKKIVKIGVEFENGNLLKRTQAVSDSFDKIKKSVQLLQASLSALEKSTKALSNLNKISNSGSFKKMVKNANLASKSIEKLNATIAAKKARVGIQTNTDKIKKFDDSVKKTVTTTKSLNDNLTKTMQLSQLRGISRGLNVGVKLAVSGGAAAIEEFSTVQDKLTQAAGVAAGTAEGFDSSYKQIEKAVKRTARTTRFEAQDTADAFLEFARAGIVAGDAVRALPDALALASATQIKAGQAAAISKDILKGYGKEISDLSEINNILVGTTTSSNTTIESLSTAMLRAAPSAQRIGLDIKDVAAFMGVMGDSAIKSGKAGTGLRQILSRLYKPSQAIKDSLKALGVSAASIKTGGMRSLITEITKAKKAIGNDQVFNELFDKAFGVRAAEKVSAFFDKGVDGFDRIKRAQEDAISSDFVKFLEGKNIATFGGQMDILNSKFKALQEQIGSKLAPMLIQMADLAGKAFDSFSDMDGENLAQIVKLTVAVTGLASALSGAATLKAGGLGLQILASAAGSAAPAIAATGTATAATLGKFGKFRKVLNGFPKLLGRMGKRIPFIGKSIGAMGAAAGGAGGMMGALGGAMTAAAGFLATFVAAVAGAIAILYGFEKIINFVLDKMGSDWTVDLLPFTKMIELATDKTFSFGDALYQLIPSALGFTNQADLMNVAIRDSEAALTDSTKKQKEAKEALDEFNSKNKAFIKTQKSAKVLITNIARLTKIGTERTKEQNEQYDEQKKFLDKLITNKEAYAKATKASTRAIINENKATLQAQSNQAKDLLNKASKRSIEASSDLGRADKKVVELNFGSFLRDQADVGVKGSVSKELDLSKFTKLLRQDKKDGGNRFDKALNPFTATLNTSNGTLKELTSSYIDQIIAAKMMFEAQAAYAKATNSQAKIAADTETVTEELKKDKDKNKPTGRTGPTKKELAEFHIKEAIDNLKREGKTLDDNLADGKTVSTAMIEGAKSIEQMIKAAKLGEQKSTSLGKSLKDTTESAIGTTKSREKDTLIKDIKLALESARSRTDAMEVGEAGKQSIKDLKLDPKEQAKAIDTIAAATVSAEADKSRNHAQALNSSLESKIDELIAEGSFSEATKGVQKQIKIAKSSTDLDGKGKASVIEEALAQRDKIDEAKTEAKKEAFAKKQEAAAKRAEEMSQVFSKVAELVGTFGEGLLTVLGSMTNFVDTLAPLLGVFGNNALTDLAGGLLGNITDGISNTAGAAVDGVSNAASSLASVAGSLLTGAGAGVAGGLGVGAAAAIPTGGTSIPIGVVLGALSGVALAISDFGEFVTSITDSMTNIMGTFIDFGMALFQQTEGFKEIETVMNGFITQMAEALEPLAQVILTIVKGPISELGGIIKGILTQISPILETLAIGFGQLLTDLAPTFMIVGAVIGDLLGFFSELMGDIDIAGIINDMAAGFIEALPSIKAGLKFFMAMFNSSMNPLQFIPILLDIMISVFEPFINIVIGLNEGLKAMTGGVDILSGAFWVFTLVVQAISIAVFGIVDAMLALPRFLINMINFAIDNILHSFGLKSDEDLKKSANKVSGNGIIDETFGNTIKSIKDLIDTVTEGPEREIDSDIDYNKLETAVEKGTKAGTTGLLNGPSGFRVALQRYRAKGEAVTGASGLSRAIESNSKNISQEEIAKANSWQVGTIIVQANDPDEFRKKLEKEDFQNGTRTLRNTPFYTGN